MKRILFLLTIILLTINAFSQDQHLIDSLEQALTKCENYKIEHIGLNNPMHDSAEANIYLQLGRIYFSNNPDKAIDYARQSLKVSERTGFKKGMARAYSLIGGAVSAKGYLDSSLSYYDKEFKILEETGDKTGLGDYYTGKGNVYSVKGDYPEALKNYYNALKVTKETRDVRGTSISYINISGIYVGQENYPAALKILNERLEELKKINFKQGIGVFEGNIANVYSLMGNYHEAIKSNKSALMIFIDTKQQRNIPIGYNAIADGYFKLKEYDSALAYYQMGYKMAVEGNFKNLMAETTVSIGEVYSEQLKFDDAIKNYLSALNIFEETHNKQSICNCYVDLGDAYLKHKNFQQALSCYSKAMAIANDAGMNDHLQDIYFKLTAVDSATGDYRAAFNHRGLYMMIKDSVSNNEKSKKINMLTMNYEFDKKQDSLNAVQARKDAIATLEIRKQKQQKYGFIIGLAIMLVFAGVFFRQRNNIKKGKKRSDELLLNILPEEVAEELKEKGSADAKLFDDVTVMFTDFKGFTTIAEKLTAKELVGEINYCFSAFDNIIHKYRIEKIKTIGDSYMAVGGLPIANKTHSKDVVNAALEINKFMEEHKQQRIKEGKEIFEIRIGIHTGPVVAGIVGIKKFAYDIWGDTVNLASRMESSGEAGKVNISGSTYELVKNDFNCIYRGKIQAKNKGEVDMYFVD